MQYKHMTLEEEKVVRSGRGSKGVAALFVRLY